MKLSIIIPCYNESENINKLYDELLPVVRNLVLNNTEIDLPNFSLIEMVFVDDGSSDDSLLKLKEYFQDENKTWLLCKFIRHETNRGLGAAIRTGFSNSEGDIIVTVDSDGTYKFSEIPSIISCLYAKDVDIVTASPYHPQGHVAGVPSNRLFLSRGSSFLYRLLVDWNIYTYTSLFRAYRSEVVKNIGFKSDGFLAGTEILVNAVSKGLRVAEFPSVLTKRMYGVSKAKILETIFAHLNFQWQLLFHRFQKVVIDTDKKQINQSHV